MRETDDDLLRVNVPVGFLLAEQQEVTITVDRPSDPPLQIRFRLVPARPAAVR